MKTLISFLAAVAFTFTQSHGQETQPGAKTNLERETMSLELTSAATNAPPSQVIARIDRRPVSYGGFLVEVGRTNRPINLLDPRTPLRGTNEVHNISTDPQTGKIRGFVLFAIRY